MKQYLELCERILTEGIKKEDRTGTGTLSVFGHQMRFDLSKGFPLLTTKKMDRDEEKGTDRFTDIAEELFWFLSGSTNIAELLQRGVNIWNADAYRWFLQHNPECEGELTRKQYIEMLRNPEEYPDFVCEGDLGRIYGKQWRSWNIGGSFRTIDQISQVIEDIKNNPDSRRLIVSAWNPTDLNDMALPPCHVLFQFYVAEGKLSCQLYQRSGDVFLGVPYNIASYALLTMLIADQTGLGYGEFIHTLGDAHIYLNHVDQVKEQVKREPKPLPKLLITKPSVVGSIFDYKRKHLMLVDYDSHGSLEGKVSVGK